MNGSEEASSPGSIKDSIGQDVWVGDVLWVDARFLAVRKLSNTQVGYITIEASDPYSHEAMTRPGGTVRCPRPGETVPEFDGWRDMCRAMQADGATFKKRSTQPSLWIEDSYWAFDSGDSLYRRSPDCTWRLPKPDAQPAKGTMAYFESQCDQQSAPKYQPDVTADKNAAPGCVCGGCRKLCDKPAPTRNETPMRGTVYCASAYREKILKRLVPRELVRLFVNDVLQGNAVEVVLENGDTLEATPQTIPLGMTEFVGVGEYRSLPAKPATRQCMNCEWAYLRNDTNGTLECRRNPPVNSLFTVVRSNDWCGEFKPTEPVRKAV